MSTDDGICDLVERFHARSMRFLELLPETCDLTLVTLKGHLIIERALFNIVAEGLSQPTYLEKARLTFFQLAQIARGMHTSPLAPSIIWDLVTGLNALRNSLAHNLEPKDVSAKVIGLWDMVIRSMEEDESDNDVAEEWFHIEKPESEVEIIRHVIHVILAGLTMISATNAVLTNFKDGAPALHPK